MIEQLDGTLGHNVRVLVDKTQLDDLKECLLAHKPFAISLVRKFDYLMFKIDVS
jgi:hypothetical protein